MGYLSDVISWLRDPDFSFWAGMGLGLYGYIRLWNLVGALKRNGAAPLALKKGMTVRIYLCVNISIVLFALTIAIQTASGLTSIVKELELAALTLDSVATFAALLTLFYISIAYGTMISRSAKKEYQSPLRQRLQHMHQFYKMRGLNEFEVILIPAVLAIAAFLERFQI